MSTPDNLVQNQLPLDDANSYDLLKDETPQETEETDLLKDEPVVEEPEQETEQAEAEEEIEVAEEEVEEQEDEELEFHAPIQMKELLAKYPNIKKEFPALFAANYREQKYAEILPTIEDAKVAVERSQTLAKFEDTIFSGETTPILGIVKQEDPTAFAKIVDNYLPALKQTDEGAFYHVVGSVIDQLAREMVMAADTHNNEDLKTAAQIMYRYAFVNKQQPPSYGGQKTVETTELTKIKQEREQFEQQRFETVSSELSQKTDNLIKSTIDKNIDPKNVMSPYVRRNAINDCLNTVKESMKADARFNKIIEGMWANARKNNYRPDDVKKIRTAILGKAKTNLRDAIRKTRDEALKGITQRPAIAEKKVVNRNKVTERKAESRPEGRLSTFELLS